MLCFRMPNQMHCPAGKAQDTAQQAADALKVKALVDAIMANAVQKHDSVRDAPCPSTGDPVNSPNVPAVDHPPATLQVLLWHPIGCS